METITNALTLKEEATRGQVAMLYGVIGLFVGVFLLGNNASGR